MLALWQSQSNCPESRAIAPLGQAAPNEVETRLLREWEAARHVIETYPIGPAGQCGRFAAASTAKEVASAERP